MSEFRLKVDLSYFYSNKKRNAYILVKRDWKTIEDLQNHIKNLFKLSDIELTVSEDSIYLPPLESIKLIGENDTIKIVPSSDYMPSIECASPEAPVKSKKVKRATPEEHTCETMPSSESTDCLDKVNHAITTLEKPKRKRKRKKKSIVMEREYNNLEKSPQNHNPRLANGYKGAHIHFDDEGEAIISEKKESVVRLVNFFDSHKTLEPRLIEAKVIENDFENLLQEEEEDVLRNNSVSTIAEKNENNLLNQVVEKGIPFEIDKVLEASTPLEGTLSVGNIILFKIYYLSENFEPSLTNFICGKVEEIDEKLKLCKIFVIDNHDEAKYAEMKFSLGSHGTAIDYIYVNIDEMAEKRLFQV